MIYESYPWKQDLLKRKRLILKYNHAELLSEDNDKAYTVIEKAIFYSAFIIRKLIDCKGKVSDEVDAYQFSLKGIFPKKRIDYMHRWPDENTHDWEHELSYTKNGKEICNWLIHSFVFFLCYNRKRFFSSPESLSVRKSSLSFNVCISRCTFLFCSELRACGSILP